MDNKDIRIRCVTQADHDFWFSLDRHLSEDAFAQKVSDRFGYVMSDREGPCGILRWFLFWDSIPFCSMLFIRKDRQRKGYGRLLMEHWEMEMKDMGFGLVMTSTQSNEAGQHFYRAIGYRDCGALTLPFPGYEQPLEIIMAKPLRQG